MKKNLFLTFLFICALSAKANLDDGKIWVESLKLLNSNNNASLQPMRDGTNDSLLLIPVYQEDKFLINTSLGNDAIPLNQFVNTTVGQYRNRSLILKSNIGPDALFFPVYNRDEWPLFKWTGSDLLFSLPTSYNKAQSLPPMLCTHTDSLKYLCGAIEIELKSSEKDYKQVIIESEEPIAGLFNASKGIITQCTLPKNMITITDRNIKTVIFPVPAKRYKKITVYLEDVNNELTTMEFNNITVERGQLTPLKYNHVNPTNNLPCHRLNLFVFPEKKAT